MPEYRRPPRLRQVTDTYEINLPPAPNAPRPNRRPPLGKVLMMGVVPALLPAIGFGVIAMATNAKTETVLPMAGMMVSAAMGIGFTTTLTRRDEDARQAAEEQEYTETRENYEDTLDLVANEAGRVFQREAAIAIRGFPAPADLLSAVTSLAPPLWERRPGDDDFLELRVGVGKKRSCVKSSTTNTINDPSAVTMLEALHWHESLPLSAKLSPGSSAGMFGTTQQVGPMLNWLLFQAAALHAPGELSIVLLSRDEDLTSWAKWLPHCGLKSKADFQSLVARVGTEATEALRAVANDLNARGESEEGGPSYLVIADGRGWPSLEQRIERWLPAGRKRVSLLVVQNRFSELSGDFDFVIDLSGSPGRVQKRVEEDEPATFAVEGMWTNDASRGAQALAALEVSAEARHTPIPPSSRLGEVLGGSAASAAAVLQTWEKSRQAFRLAAPIGIGADDQIVELDLRRDGPHGILAGTTGSGKSEFLQSLVVSLAAKVSPDLLNFILVDYKGGAAFREIAGLPHVVGIVTDLDDRLATRALTSLRAEMKRREALLGASQPPATNIIEYQSAPRREPLANLVIIIDEFHRLVSEQPDFIEEMVQIAQQGRSLGVHLLLATQKPSGVITDHIRANTNLRICLRVTDEADSRDVLGGPEAAFIPRDLPGRVYMRVGSEPLRVCQAGRVSGMVPARAQLTPDIKVRSFLPPLAPPSFQRGTMYVQAAGSVTRDVEEEASDEEEMVDERDVLIQSIRSAALQAGFPEQQPPWQPHLQEEIALDEVQRLDAEKRDAGTITIGVLDEPEIQRQQPFVVDLDAGHVCVAGGSNSGKTEALLTIATAAARRWPASELHMYAIDFGGGGLEVLAGLPHCGGVAQQHDPARVHWVLQALRDFVGERLRSRGGPGAGAFPRTLVFVDNFPAFYGAIGNLEDGQDAAEELHEIMDVGRSVGVTFVISVERPDALRAAVVALLQTRLLLDITDPGAYAVFGLSQFKQTAQAIPGRAVIPGRFVHEVQIAHAGAALDALRGRAPSANGRGPLAIAPLPAEVPYNGLVSDATRGGAVPGLLIGLAEGTRPLFVHPQGTHLVVIGPRRSGRSNALAVAALEGQRLQETETYVINPRRSLPLRSIATAAEAKKTKLEYAERLPDVEALLNRASEQIMARQAEYVSGREAFEPWIILIDDIDVLDVSPMVGDVLATVALRGADLATTLMIAADSQALRSSYPSGVTRALLNQRTGILLAPTTPEDFDFFGVRGRPGRLPPGRGFYCTAGAKHAIQVALLEEAAP